MATHESGRRFFSANDRRGPAAALRRFGPIDAFHGRDCTAEARKLPSHNPARLIRRDTDGQLCACGFLGTLHLQGVRACMPRACPLIHDADGSAAAREE